MTETLHYFYTSICVDLLKLKDINTCQNKKRKSFEQRTLFCVSRHKISLQVMEPLTKEVLEKVRGEFGLKEQRVREAIEHLKDWIQLQHHLPKEIGRFDKDSVNCTTIYLTVGNKTLRPSPFWNIRQSILEVVCRCFGTVCSSH